jgi:hypothetical protein
MAALWFCVQEILVEYCLQALLSHSSLEEHCGQLISALPLFSLLIQVVYCTVGVLYSVPDPHGKDTDPALVRGMDPRIRIRIHTKISWIRNTGTICSSYIPL